MGLKSIKQIWKCGFVNDIIISLLRVDILFLWYAGIFRANLLLSQGFISREIPTKWSDHYSRHRWYRADDHRSDYTSNSVNKIKMIPSPRKKTTTQCHIKQSPSSSSMKLSVTSGEQNADEEWENVPKVQLPSCHRSSQPSLAACWSRHSFHRPGVVVVLWQTSGRCLSLPSTL